MKYLHFQRHGMAWRFLGLEKMEDTLGIRMAFSEQVMIPK